MHLPIGLGKTDVLAYQRVGTALVTISWRGRFTDGPTILVTLAPTFSDAKETKANQKLPTVVGVDKTIPCPRPDVPYKATWNYSQTKGVHSFQSHQNSELQLTPRIGQDP